MSNMNFLIAYVIKFSSETKITFSQGDATKIKSEQFSELGSRTETIEFGIPRCLKLSNRRTALGDPLDPSD